MTRLVQTLLKEIPEQLGSTHARVEGERLEKNFKEEEAKAYGELDGFAESRDFALHRDAGRLLFTLRGPEGRAMTEDEMVGMPGLQRLVRRHDECVPAVVIGGRLAWHDGSFAAGFGDQRGYGTVLRAVAPTV